MRWLLLVLAACGGSSSPVDQLCSANGPWTKWALAQARCVADADQNPLFDAAYMEDNCRQTLQPLFDAGVVTIGSSAVLDMCNKALAANTCAPELYKDWWSATRICEEVIVGQRVTGEPCSVDAECAGTAMCAIPSGACGVCMDRKGEGATCTANRECASELCASGTCAKRDQPQLSTCTVDAQCGDGLICRDAGHCESLSAAATGSCTSDADCGAYQASCLSGTCVALAKTSQACTGWSQTPVTHPHCEWFHGDGCLSGTCQPLPTAAAGAACGVDVALCADGAYCTGGKCVTIVAAGGFCNGNADCGPYAVCLSGHTCSFSDFNAVCEPSQGGGL